MLAKYLVPALVAVSMANAASNPKCKQKTVTIENLSDAMDLGSSCKVFTGNIEISPNVVDEISFEGLERITGDLTANGAVNMTKLSSNTLTSIGGTMKLTSLTIMNNLVFPSLSSVGAISWTTLNALQRLTFTTGVTEAESIFITDTALVSLDGINLAQVGNFEITNNAYLRSISTQVGNVTQALTINNNGQNLELEFPNLIWAYNMTVRNVSSLSIPSLKHVNSTFGVYGSYMESVNAPNLTTVDGDVAFVADPSLTNISLPLLKSIKGALLVANNSALLDITGFPSLERVGGALSISGNFTSAEFPSLEDVQGTFNAQTSGNFSCTEFNKLQNQQVVKGDVFCKGRSDNVQTTPDGSTSGDIDSLDGGDDDDKDDAASGLRVSGVFVAVAALLGGLLAL